MKQYLAITNEVFNYNKTLSPKLVINKTNYHFTLISFLYFSLTSNITSDKHLNGWQVYSLIPTQFHTEKKHFMATTCISTGNRQTRKRVRTHHHKLAHIPSPRICATECSIFWHITGRWTYYAQVEADWDTYMKMIGGQEEVNIKEISWLN